MKINTFVHFPENENDFFKIGEEVENYTTQIEEIALIKKKLKDDAANFELFYDKNNLESFVQKADTMTDGCYLGNIKSQLRRIIGIKSTDISEPVLRKNDCHYLSWEIRDFSITQLHPCLIEAAESKNLNSNNEHTIIINLFDAFKSSRDSIHVIKDAVHYPELPILVAVPLVNGLNEFLSWFSLFINTAFSLRDSIKFQRTNFRWNLQCIYREISTGNYWYFDYFHKDNKVHYEVFNSEGNHIGEATEVGILDRSKASKEKKITNIIH